MAALRLDTAAWVVPVVLPPLPNAGVVRRGKQIIAVGESSKLRALYPEAKWIDQGQAALTPSLVNAHTHLELSHLGALAASPHTGSFPEWIGRLIRLRDATPLRFDDLLQSALDSAQAQYAHGVSVIADIGNSELGRHLAPHFQGKILPFKEYFGFATATLGKNLARLRQEPESGLCSAHAPYSTHPELLQEVKDRAKRLGQISPIHAAEPASERQLLATGQGEMADFLRQRNAWDAAFEPMAEPVGSIHYLNRLGFLDAQTLCVHAIHVAAEEIRLMAEKKVKVCLCPGSNRFLNVGKAPVQDYLAQGILPALGTDSPASNPRLSLWREMALLAEDHPALPVADIFAIATLGGARALGLEASHGSLEAGKDADILRIDLTHQQPHQDLLMEFLVRGHSLHDPTVTRI